MLDEHYRYLEAIQNRRDYIEDQIQAGSPVVGLVYNDGILILTVTSGQKIYEVYNHLALSAIGHTADVERLRLLVTDAASVQGFQSSVDDVTLHRLTHFVLCPPIKQSFESIFNAPTIAKILMVELGPPHQLVAINYDGTTRTSQNAEVIGGTDRVERTMRNYIGQTDIRLGDELTLKQAFELALLTWAVGRTTSSATEYGFSLDPDRGESDQTSEAEDFSTDELISFVQAELEESLVEASILQISKRSKSKFRRLTADEVADMTPLDSDKAQNNK